MSQIKLSSSVQNPDNLVSMVGSEAKNPLPTQLASSSSWAEAVGLFWMFLDDPWSLRNHIDYIKNNWKK